MSESPTLPADASVCLKVLTDVRRMDEDALRLDVAKSFCAMPRWMRSQFYGEVLASLAEQEAQR